MSNLYCSRKKKNDIEKTVNVANLLAANILQYNIIPIIVRVLTVAEIQISVQHVQRLFGIPVTHA